MTEIKEMSKKEAYIYFGYGIGIVLLLFGAIMPKLNGLWMTVVGGTLLVATHISFEAMQTRKIILDCRKTAEEKGEQ